jgi:hypothetical protein
MLQAVQLRDAKEKEIEAHWRVVAWKDQNIQSFASRPAGVASLGDFLAWWAAPTVRGRPPGRPVFSEIRGNMEALKCR